MGKLPCAAKRSKTATKRIRQFHPPCEKLLYTSPHLLLSFTRNLVHFTSSSSCPKLMDDASAENDIGRLAVLLSSADGCTLELE